MKSLIIHCANSFPCFVISLSKNQKQPREVFFVKKSVLRNFANSQENTCAIIKESLAQTLSFEMSAVSKNTFFTEHLQTTASEKWLATWEFVKTMNWAIDTAQKTKFSVKNFLKCKQICKKLLTFSQLMNP